MWFCDHGICSRVRFAITMSVPKYGFPNDRICSGDFAAEGSVSGVVLQLRRLSPAWIMQLRRLLPGVVRADSCVVRRILL